MDRILNDNFDSKFRVILLAAERAEQLMAGARPKLVHDSPKVARRAMEEVLEGLIEWERGPAPSPTIEEFDEESTVSGEETAASE